jgi:uncharacterized membrane-anchored protein
MRETGLMLMHVSLIILSMLCVIAAIGSLCVNFGPTIGLLGLLVVGFLIGLILWLVGRASEAPKP